MDNKDLNNVTTRTQRKEIEEAMKKDALEKREELKKVLFEEEAKTNKNVFLKFIFCFYDNTSLVSSVVRVLFWHLDATWSGNEQNLALVQVINYH